MCTTAAIILVLYCIITVHDCSITHKIEVKGF